MLIEAIKKLEASGIVDTQDLRCNRLYPKAEAVRIVLQYRAYRHYAAARQTQRLATI